MEQSEIIASRTQAILHECLAKMYRERERLMEELVKVNREIDAFPRCSYCLERVGTDHICLGVPLAAV